jgi:hypothetical protein
MAIGPFRFCLVLLLASPADPAGAKDASPPPLPNEVAHPSGAFSFRTPAGWTTGSSPTNPKAFQAEGDGVLVRFIFEPSEVGFDALHALCMMERLAGGLESEPRVEYEYDFVSGIANDKRVLDSAFVVTYDAKILGYQQWRQRNVTLVGGGQSLCAITYAPAPLWKKSKPIRALLDGIVRSITFR